MAKPSTASNSARPSPARLAEATLAARLADLNGAAIAIAEPHRFLT
jgi:hypothetical protein